MIFFIIPVSNDDSDKNCKTEFFCELYKDGKFSYLINLKLIYSSYSDIIQHFSDGYHGYHV